MDEHSLDWLEKLVVEFPKSEPIRKNIIDIAGYPSWENVNSNLLAFYLDEKEEHGFGRLFINSLLKLLVMDDSIAGRELFNTEYSVERESGFIDLLLKAEDGEGIASWAIIIENKIKAPLNNDLRSYYEKVDAVRKFGIVLSLHSIGDVERLTFQIEEASITFKNITHQELARKIMTNLPEFYEKSDDRHLLFLKEYFANIKSHYKMEKPDETLEKMLRSLQNHHEKIKYLDKSRNIAHYYVLERLNHVFQQYEFSAKNTRNSKSKTFYQIGTVKREDMGYLRFWVDIDKLVQENYLRIYFELCGDGVEYGQPIRSCLVKAGMDRLSGIEVGADTGTNHFHLASLNTLLSDSLTLDKALSIEISKFFEDNLEGQSIVTLSLNKLRTHIPLES